MQTSGWWAEAYRWDANEIDACREVVTANSVPLNLSQGFLNLQECLHFYIFLFMYALN